MTELRFGFGSVVVLVAFSCLAPTPASAGAIGYVGTGGFGAAGTVVDASCFTCTFSVTSPFDTGVLLDGLRVTGVANETIQQVGGFTTTALLRITDILAIDTNLNGAPVNDNLYLFSDQFNPSPIGTGGVGIVGSYVNAVAPVGGDIAFASMQAQMQFNLVAVQPGQFTIGSSLTTPPTFVSCFGCSPVPFWEAARGPIVVGTTQLVGVLNFQLAGAGSSVSLPGSVILDENDPQAFQSEVPEPGSLTLNIAGAALMVIAWLVRRGRARVPVPKALR
jgi:hypothetical protein